MKTKLNSVLNKNYNEERNDVLLYYYGISINKSKYLQLHTFAVSVRGHNLIDYPMLEISLEKYHSLCKSKYVKRVYLRGQRVV